MMIVIINIEPIHGLRTGPVGVIGYVKVEEVCVVVRPWRGAISIPACSVDAVHNQRGDIAVVIGGNNLGIAD